MTALWLVGALGLGASVALAAPPEGALVFGAHCARCHGQSGKADTPQARALKVRPLVNDAAIARMTAADVVQAIRSDAKHQSMGSLTDVDDAEMQAVAAFVKGLAAKKR